MIRVAGALDRGRRRQDGRVQAAVRQCPGRRGQHGGSEFRGGHSPMVVAASHPGAGQAVAENEAQRGQGGAGGPARGSAVCVLRR
jgi:hypothetical protein